MPAGQWLDLIEKGNLYEKIQLRSSERDSSNGNCRNCRDFQAHQS